MPIVGERLKVHSKEILLEEGLCSERMLHGVRPMLTTATLIAWRRCFYEPPSENLENLSATIEPILAAFTLKLNSVHVERGTQADRQFLSALFDYCAMFVRQGVQRWGPHVFLKNPFYKEILTLMRYLEKAFRFSPAA